MTSKINIFHVPGLKSPKIIFFIKPAVRTTDLKGITEVVTKWINSENPPLIIDSSALDYICIFHGSDKEKAQDD